MTSNDLPLHAADNAQPATPGFREDGPPEGAATLFPSPAGMAGQEFAVWLVRWLVAGGGAPALLGRDDVSMEGTGFAFGRSLLSEVADLIVVDPDGGMTVVAIADVQDEGDFLAGIGRALDHGQQARDMLCGVAEVTPALAWTTALPVAVDAHMQDICAMAGVKPLPLGRQEDHRKALGRIFGGADGDNRQ